jgi:DNA mismatch repair protein MutS
MDEVGRGTSTFDGLALAWAIAEQMAQSIQGYCLFATHYFELTTLAEQFNNTVNIHLNAIEHQDKIVFMHQVQEGPASQSYGLQVAALAGVPNEVIRKAKTHLHRLENQTAAQSGHSVTASGADETPVQQFDLFAAGPANPKEIEALLDELGDLKVDDLTPRKALDKLYELTDIVKEFRG